jgi:hypothetical protein
MAAFPLLATQSPSLSRFLPHAANCVNFDSLVIDRQKDFGRARAPLAAPDRNRGDEQFEAFECAAHGCAACAAIIGS